MKFLLSAVVFSLLSQSPPQEISLERFLNLVQQQNRNIKIASKRIQVAEQAKSEPELVFSPQATAGLAYEDARSAGGLSFQQKGASSKVLNQSLGLSKEWSSGTNTSLSHSLQRNDFEGLQTTNGEAFWQNRLTLRLEQDLWSNFFGRKSRAQVHELQHQLESARLNEKFRIRQLLSDAEKAYWAAAVASEVRSSLEKSLERTQGILDWNTRRAKLKVVDKGDVLQSRAALFQLKQRLEEVKRQELEAKRSLRFFLGEVDESAAMSPSDELRIEIDQVELPDSFSPEKREDLKALKKLTEASDAAYRKTDYELDPNLNLYASYSGNSNDSEFSSAESQVFDNSFRQYEVGLQLAIPLGFRTNKNVRASKQKEKEATYLEYNQAKLAIEKAFLDLKTRIRETISKLQVAESLEQTQREKLSNEDKRFRQGRSSSFQILTFEEDLAEAELQRIRLYAQLRQLLADLELFSGPLQK